MEVGEELTVSSSQSKHCIVHDELKLKQYLKSLDRSWQLPSAVLQTVLQCFAWLRPLWVSLVLLILSFALLIAFHPNNRQNMSLGQICTDNMCWQTEAEEDSHSCYLTQPRSTDTTLISPSTDPITSSIKRGSH